MKNLGKYIITAIIIAATMALSSCIQYYPCEATGEYFAGNITDKEVAIWLFSSGVGVDENKIKCIGDYYSRDTMYYTMVIDGSIVPINASVMKYKIPPESPVEQILSYTYSPFEDLVECKYQEPYFGKYAVFNLTDTTSVWQGCGALGRNRNGLIDRFVEVLYSYDNNKSDEVHWTYKLTVTDSLLSLMEKDTSMLSLFPEYYGSSR